MNKKAIAAALLPQYRLSAAFMERFLVAAHGVDSPISRSTTTSTRKHVDGSELESDVLDYFTTNATRFRDEFQQELEGRVSPAEFSAFCEVVSKEWFDGMATRKSGRPQRLKRSVHDYLSKIVEGELSADQLVQMEAPLQDVEPLISADAVAAILTTNDRMIFRHIEEWKQRHPNWDTISNADVYLRRGLVLTSAINVTEPYREWDYINSYSISFSAPEQFAQPKNGGIPAIINGDLALFSGRILFFSPFIPDMDAKQLELGVIPSERPLPIFFQGEHAGVMEYMIDPLCNAGGT